MRSRNVACLALPAEVLSNEFPGKKEWRTTPLPAARAAPRFRGSAQREKLSGREVACHSYGTYQNLSDWGQSRQVQFRKFSGCGLNKFGEFCDLLCFLGNTNEMLSKTQSKLINDHQDVSFYLQLRFFCLHFVFYLRWGSLSRKNNPISGEGEQSIKTTKAIFHREQKRQSQFSTVCRKD